MNFPCNMSVMSINCDRVLCVSFDGTYFGDFGAVPLLLHLEIYPATDAAGHLST